MCSLLCKWPWAKFQNCCVVVCCCHIKWANAHKLYNNFLICVLQYRFYGEPVVKAAVENGSHYLDVSGEPEVRFIRQPNQFFTLIVLCRYVWISNETHF